MFICASSIFQSVVYVTVTIVCLSSKFIICWVSVLCWTRDNVLFPFFTNGCSHFFFLCLSCLCWICRIYCNRFIYSWVFIGDVFLDVLMMLPSFWCVLSWCYLLIILLVLNSQIKWIPFFGLLKEALAGPYRPNDKEVEEYMYSWLQTCLMLSTKMGSQNCHQLKKYVDVNGSSVEELCKYTL